MNAPSLTQARSAKKRALTVFSSLADVAGVGITRNNHGYSVKINLRAPPAPGIDLPTVIEGVPVKVEVVGPITKR